MKKILVALALITVTTAAWAQGEAVTKFFDKYAGDESFTTQATISSKMFSLFTNMEVTTPEDKEIVDAISKIKGLRVLGKDKVTGARSYYTEALGVVTKSKYDELMSVRDKDKDMKFYIKETSPGKVGEFVMLIGSNTEFMIISLFGEIDLKQISKIGRKMNVGGLDHLEKMGGKKD
ncbi:MAG TPA: DUF4252 domain-containing protein [Cyclobacteriaceae bacterium]|nr:DUF4252 domain-containing protein [Cyclobacteriaceae bacterium]